jgi:RNA polymerase sigma factor (sigma-70 family)
MHDAVEEHVDPVADDELLAAWRGGDQAAGERLFDRHADAIARFFENKVTRGAEDLVQAAFLRMLEGRDRFRGEGTFRGFAFGVARNVLREHLRELIRDRQVDPSFDSMAELAPGPSTVVGLREEHQLMLEGLRHLALDDQILLELFYWEDLSSDEVAAILGIPASSTRRRLSEARTRLDAKMAEIAASPALLDRTVRHLESWVADVRGQLGAKKRRRKR